MVKGLGFWKSYATVPLSGLEKKKKHSVFPYCWRRYENSQEDLIYRKGAHKYSKNINKKKEQRVFIARASYVFVDILQHINRERVGISLYIIICTKTIHWEIRGSSAYYVSVHCENLRIITVYIVLVHMYHPIK